MPLSVSFASNTSLTTDASGNLTAELRYLPFGETRYESGQTPTEYRFTGQREAAEVGLYFYGARWYDASLGRFIQADTIIPEPGSPMAWDRYAYSGNNSLKYIDPDGHCPLLVTAAVGAVIGASVDYGFQVIKNVSSGQNLDQAFVNVDVAEIAGAAVAGGVAGLSLGVGTAVSALVTEVAAVPVAVAGGLGNGIGGQLGALTEAGVRQIGQSELDKDQYFSDALEAGFLDADSFVSDIGVGAILGAGGQAFSNLTAPSTADKYRFCYSYIDLEGNIITEPIRPPLKNPGEISLPEWVSSGFMQKASDWIQEIVSQGIDRHSQREQY